MGMGAARSCLRAGLTTYGADLNPQALAVLQQAGAKQTAPSARDFATELDAVLLLVVNAAQVKQILFGEQGRRQSSGGHRGDGLFDHFRR